MKILVTGANGFLGRYVVEALRCDYPGSSIRALVMRDAELHLHSPGTEILQGNILDRDCCERICEKVSVVLHLAGRVSRSERDGVQLHQLHVEGTRVLLESAKAAGVTRVVLASTSGTIAVSDSPDELPNETAQPPLNLINGWPYYMSKLYQENTALSICQTSPELCILNPSLLLGPGDTRLSSTSDVLKFMKRQIPIVPSGGLNFVDVRDVAPVFSRAVKYGGHRKRYLLGGPNWSFEQFFSRLERICGVPRPKITLSPPIARWGASFMSQIGSWVGTEPPIDPLSVDMGRRFWYLDDSLARQTFGFQNRDPQTTLYETFRDLAQRYDTSKFISDVVRGPSDGVAHGNEEHQR